MASSRVTVHEGNVRTYFQGGTGGSARGRGAGGGVARAEKLAARMVIAARFEAATFHQRTTQLITSVVPIVRTGRGGDVEVGVGTTVEHGKWLEIGTDVHVIASARPFNPKVPKGHAGRGYLLRSNTAKWIALKGEVPDGFELEKAQNSVVHPGNPAFGWLSDAVRKVVPGGRVRVRVHR